MHWRKIILYSCLGGFLSVLGFPSKLLPALPFIPILGTTFFFIAFFHYARNFKQSFYSLFFYSFTFGIIGYYWVPETLRVFGNLTSPSNYLLTFFFFFIIHPQLWFFLLARHFIGKNVPVVIRKLPVSSRNFLLALMLTLCEAWIPQQFPGHLGHTWINLSPYLGLAPLFGVPVFSLASTWLALGLLTYYRQHRFDKPSLLFFSLFLIANITFPLKKESLQAPKSFFRIVQANIGNSLKDLSLKSKGDAAKAVTSIFTDLSLQPSKKPLDLIIWPETAFPYDLNSNILKHQKRLSPYLLKKVTLSAKASLLTGAYDRSRSREKFNFESSYNSAFLFNSNGDFNQVFHKHKLIPFGETLPLGPLNKFAAQYVQNISYFAQGKQYSLFTTEKGVRFITPICYEMLFSSFIRRYLNQLPEQPHLMINLTNDSWYGDTSEPLQHLMLAKWRALEFGMPLIRSTNTGISSVIYPDGSESTRLAYGKQGNLDIKLRLGGNKATIFQHLGIFALLILSLLIFPLTLFSKD